MLKFQRAWKVQGSPDTIKPGATVVVTRKDGTPQDVVIDVVSSVFLDKHGAKCVYGYPARREPKAPKPTVADLQAQLVALQAKLGGGDFPSLAAE